MATQRIEDFAQILIKEVRDRAITSCDNMLASDANGIVAKRWRNELNGAPDCASFAKYIIPDCVDNTIFHLLNAIDEGILRMSYIDAEGNIIDLKDIGEGELAGLYMASREWRARYSKQRFVDDFEDM